MNQAAALHLLEIHTSSLVARRQPTTDQTARMKSGIKHTYKAAK